MAYGLREYSPPWTEMGHGMWLGGGRAYDSCLLHSTNQEAESLGWDPGWAITHNSHSSIPILSSQASS